jgi:triphosphatase
VPVEIELKLALDRAALRRLPQLPRAPAIVAARKGPTRKARLVSTYYDTVDGRLARDGIALRVRRDGRRWLQTVKGPTLPGAGAGLSAREEHEWRISGPRIDAARLAQTPWHKTFAKLRKHRRLVAQFTTEFTRRTVALAFADATRAELAIDVGTIRTRHRPPRSVPIREIEIEVERGNPVHAFAVALSLLDDWPLAIATANKAERGNALVRGKPDGWNRPVHADAVALAADATAEAALRSIAQECLRQIAANFAGLLQDRDPEWVHQMRIGTRRLRSALALIASLAPPKLLDAVVAETKWLAGVLGRARDWDVFTVETLPPLRAGVADDEAAAAGLRRLARRAALQRNAAREAVREALSSPRFPRLLLTLGAVLAVPRFGASVADEDDAFATSARAFAQALLDTRHHKLIARGVSLAQGTSEERHAVRIAAKKLRYAAEFFAPLFAGKRTRTYLKRLGALQDALGLFNDAATATRLAAELASERDPAAVGAVGGWVAAQAASLRPALDRAWRRFGEAERFWT